MLGNFVSKFHELVLVVDNKDPHRLNAHLEQTTNESYFQNITRHTLFWGRTDVFNDQFGRLTGIEPLFRGVRAAVIDHFLSLLINLSSMGLPIADNRYPRYVEPVEVSIHEV